MIPQEVASIAEVFESHGYDRDSAISAAYEVADRLTKDGFVIQKPEEQTNVTSQ